MSRHSFVSAETNVIGMLPGVKLGWCFWNPNRNPNSYRLILRGVCRNRPLLCCIEPFSWGANALIYRILNPEPSLKKKLLLEPINHEQGI